MKKNALILESLAVAHNDHTLIRVDTRIEPGSITTVMGPSGVGKSLLLCAIAGVLPAGFSHLGNVCYGDTVLSRMPAHQRHLGILFQDPLLFEHMDVAQNIAFGMSGSKGQNRAEAERLLSEVGLSGYGERAVQALSGGQQARVALLRTLASSPRAVLLDEPFSKLDTHTRAKTREWVFDSIRQRQLPCIMVTHDEEDARAAKGLVITVQSSDYEDNDEQC